MNDCTVNGKLGGDVGARLFFSTMLGQRQPSHDSSKLGERQRKTSDKPPFDIVAPGTKKRNSSPLIVLLLGIYFPESFSGKERGAKNEI